MADLVTGGAHTAQVDNRAGSDRWAVITAILGSRCAGDVSDVSCVGTWCSRMKVASAMLYKQGQ
jgi:hypothetical protein